LPDQQPGTVPSSGIEQRPLWERINGCVFGYDFFISYTWADGREYALALTRELEKLGFDCFLDSDDYRKGDHWKRMGGWTLRRTSRLVLLATPESGRSEAVLTELKIYTGLGRQIIPVCFARDDQTAAADLMPREFLPYLDAAVLFIRDRLSCGQDGRQVAGPAPHVAKELRDTFDLMRQDQWRTRVLGCVAVTLSLLLVVAMVLGWSARQNALASARNARQATSNQAHSYFQLAKIAARDARWADEIYWYAQAAALPVRDDPQTLAAANFVAHRSRRIVNTVTNRGRILCLAFSPDGQTLAIGDSVHSLQLWHVATAEPLGEPLPHSGPVTSVAFSPDQRLLLTGTAGEVPTVNLWNLETRSRMYNPILHKQSPSLICFADDGNHFHTATETELRSFSTATGEPIGNPFPVHALAVSPADNKVLVRGGFSTARGWESQTGTTTGRPMRLNSYACLMSPTGDRLLAGDPNGYELWDPWQGLLLGRFASPAAPVFTPDGQHILAVNSEKKLLACDASSGELRERGELLAHPRVIRVDAGGHRLLAAGHDNVIRVIDPQTGATMFPEIRVEPAGAAFPPSSPWLRDAFFSPDGNLVLAELNAAPAQLFNVVTGQRVGDVLKAGKTHSPRFSPDGTRVFTAGDSTARRRTNDVRLWNTANGQQVGQPLPHRDHVNAIEFSNNSKMLATASQNSVHVWSATDGTALLELPHDDAPEAIAFSPDDTLVATATPKHLRIWRAHDGTMALTHPIEHNSPHSARHLPRIIFSSPERLICFGDDATRIFSTQSGELIGEPVHGMPLAMNSAGRIVAMEDSGLRRWDLTTRQPAGPPIAFDGLVAAFSPDGKQLAAGDGRSQAQIVGDWGEHKVQHTNAVYSLAFHPDGLSVLTGSHDGTAKLTSVVDGMQIGETIVHEEEVEAVAFGPDGHSVAIATGHVARIWSLRSLPSRTLPAPPGGFQSAVFSTSSAHVLMTNYDTFQLWDPNGQPGIGIPVNTGKFITTQAVGSDEKVMTADEDGVVKLWDGMTGGLIWQEGRFGNGSSGQYPNAILAFSPDAKTCAVSLSQEVHVCDTATAKPLCAPLPQTVDISAMAFAPQGDLLVVGTSNNTAQLWNFRTGSAIGKPLPHDSAVQSICFSHDGTRFLTIEQDKASLWNLRLEPIGTSEFPDWTWLRAAFSPDDRLILLAGEDSGGAELGCIYDAATMQALGPVVTGQPSVGFGFSPNGELYCLGGVVYSVRNHLQVAKPPELQFVAGNPSGLHAVRFGNDGQTLRAAGLEVDSTGLVVDSGGSPSVVEFELPAPALRAPGLLPLAVEVRTGYTWDDNGNKRLMSAAEHRKKRDVLKREMQLLGLQTPAAAPDTPDWKALSAEELQELRHPLQPFVP
jgi:WD40 repeat protein